MTEFTPKNAAYHSLLEESGTGKLAGARLSPAAAELALGEVADGVIVTDRHGLVCYSNPLVSELCGNLVGLLPGQVLADSLPLFDDEGEALDLNLASGDREEDIPSRRELRANIRRETGELLEISVQINSLKNDAVLEGYVLVLRHTSDARRISSRLSWQSSHDALTHLPNRQTFEHALQQLLNTDTGPRQHHILLYLDVYQFKVVNDTLGYSAGDALLIALAKILTRCLGNGDLLGRVGSDEFALLLKDCTLEEAKRIVTRLREAVNGFVFQWEDSETRPALSIGAVSVDSHAPPASQLLASSNDACSAARDQGRNRVKFFGDSRKALEKRRESTWLAEIHAAIREDRLLLYRQPVVALQDQNRVHHYEVLVRMQGRDGDVISPGLFLPAAERYGMIDEVDRWVIRNILRYMALEQSSGSGGFHYAINISGISLGDELFADFVLRELTEAGVAPSRVQFEITETSAINNLDRALVFIHKLRAAGCSFALDDFGRGASSLAYLRQLPVDYLKIDGSFVRNMLEDEIDSAMVSTVDHLAKRMGISTIAEFAETPELLEKLRLMGVDYAQGFGIAAAACLPEISGPRPSSVS
ncbi:EAL domain-containing protein [Microbulbifer hydrolyticus]|uniref:Diguanylate cyclase (GGDEF)-like protein n=1 Tax=Microbulbifer hydrolyticus TaxID=48074 RepID=A0A6P1TF71_9GAMM|nr:EAL domain-containing protein [Microbulbifer hydrolyticus]MBB5212946.1 diguanylate cyclase (GGDEF)-like protein [Microbulbifer hydrolyticus]QHQ40316.1 EAL domain-containing protein [Microbulbifer hydrolyticus]